MDEYYKKAWADQTGADYNLLFGDKSKGQSTTTGSQAMNELGFTLPSGGNTTTDNTQPLFHNEDSRTETGSQTPTTTTPTTGYTLDDYYKYYGYDWTKIPEGMDYNKWVTWMQNGGGSTNPGSTGVVTPGNTDQTQGNNDAWNEYISLYTKGASGTALTNDELTRLLELYNYYMKGGGTSGTGITTPGSTGTPGSGSTGGVTHNYPAVDTDNRQRILDMYDAQIAAERAALQEQGDQALSDAQANRDNIAKLYNQQRNAASVDWERQRRNFLEAAATSGLNTGAGSQAELAMMGEYQRNQTNLGVQQAQAETEADRNIADIKRSTQASINEAISKNDYQKAAALLDEYNEQYNRAMDRAEALAQYGDFSGYAALYGDEAAAQMRYTWIMSNPEIALAMGAITSQQYAQLTLYSQYPALALTGATGGSSGDAWAYGGSGWNGSGTSTDTGTTTSGGGGSGGIPSYSGMAPETYAAIINSMIASGEIPASEVDEYQRAIREAYGQNP